MNGEQAERILTETASFWARVEILGRRCYFGKVSVETLGGAALLRVDVPPIPEHTVRERGYWRETNEPVGTAESYGNYDLTYPTVPGHSHLVGIGSIYELTPLPEEAVMKLAARDATKEALIKVVRVQEQKQIEGTTEDDTDKCDVCGHKDNPAGSCDCMCHRFDGPF